jgi:hypothetical protein
MREETIRIARELLFWQVYIRSRRTSETVTLHDLVPYKKLCERAGIPDAYRIVGEYLGELATWCKDNNLPPLNCLAVNGETLIPGIGYDSADGCSYETWWKDVQKCVDCMYPERILEP